MWRFKELGRGDTRRRPREFEFFRKMKNITEAFVREVIQNSLDAKVNSSEKVLVIFTLKSVEYDKIKKYLNDDFKKRLVNSQTIDDEEFNWDNVKFLTVEDFGTRGLDGSLDIPEEGEESNFYNFFWDEGESEKKESKIGRWGLGKTTIYMVSQIKTFWGLTIRCDDKKELLMGKVLFKKPYTYENRWFQYYGYFVGNDNFEPIFDKKIIQDFKEIFSIKRKDEPGLSLIIPFLIKEVTPQLISKSVIIHYFYPIAKGSLVVRIDEVEINKDNLKDIALSLDWRETSWETVDVKRVLNFINECLLIKEENFINVSLPTSENPKIEHIKENIFENFKDIKEKFLKEETIAFKFPLKIKRKKPFTTKLDKNNYQKIQEELSPKNTYFLIYLKKDNSLIEPVEFWIRSNVRITDITTLSQPVLGMMIAEDKVIATFLGDAETPAHTDWEEKNEEFKDTYYYAKDILNFIKRSMKTLVSLLDEPPKDILKDFLDDIFSIPVECKENEKKSSEKKKDKEWQSKPQIINLTNLLPAGFRLSLNSEILKQQNISFPFKTTIRVAYRRRRGDPFKNYSLFDFDFKNLKNQITINSGKIIKLEENIIEVEIEKEDFNLEVKGFDPKRDLIIKIMILLNKENKNDKKI